MQYSSLLDLDPGSDKIRKVLSFAREHLARPLTVDELAEIAHLSVRQFSRAFVTATGLTPAKAVERLRLDAARPLVEESGEAFETIAQLSASSTKTACERASFASSGNRHEQATCARRRTAEPMQA